jgi:unsaturated chondroitin disaccharide hydrolase
MTANPLPSKPLKLDAIADHAVERIRRNIDIFGDQFPSYGDGNHAYHLTPNKNWLASFWAGLLWLSAVHTDNADLSTQTSKLLPSFIARLDNNIRLNHDIGFLFTLSARAQWQQTADDLAKDVALRAADCLLARYRPIGGFIQAWDDEDNRDESGHFIIDCMMNLPLLYWATRETDDPKYADAATAHAQVSARYLVREDGTTYHTYFLDPSTGDPIGPKTHQGYADDSVWSRGQAWAIYGFTMAYEWTQQQLLLETAIATANRYLQEAPPDAISPWDYRLSAEAPAYPDSSADAIAAGGLLRLAKASNKPTYRDAAIDRVRILHRDAYDHHEQGQGLLLHGTQHAPHNYGIDTYTIFGDFFFLETVMHLLGTAPDFWGPNAK